ncbi:MAG TPA: peptidoglycan DD-metalloendopeptidase family protein [Alphaproteobacteria bacterium]|jgi:murein DD-endopeptidase MepM/ murein hydrolase activator NlpD
MKAAVAAVARGVARAFPEREILLRSNGQVRFLRLSRNAQLVIAACLLSLLGWMAYSAAVQVFNDSILSAKNAELARVQNAYRTLQADTNDSETRYKLITQSLEAKQAYLLGVLEQNGSLRDSLGQLNSQLDSSEAERTRIVASREALRAQIKQLEDKLASATDEKNRLAGDLTSRTGELQTAIAERARVLQEHGRMQARAGELEQRLQDLQTGQKKVLDKLAARTVGSIEEAREIIGLTGLDPERLLANADTKAGIGGPFVAAATRAKPVKGKKAPATAEPELQDVSLAALNSHIDRWDNLQLIVRRLPLATPTDNYLVMSPFGTRKDPFNNKAAFHPGVDLSGQMKAPIYSTGPGIVVAAGKNGDYGLSVDIDHGMGIITRYGHLSGILVQKGQTVTTRQQIGLMGHTGRATGVHVHYEIQFNGKPIDPMKFIQAGRYVFKG